MASGQFVNPLSVAPAVVAPPLQTQLHHRGGVVVSHATPNGNPVNLSKQHGATRWVCQVGVSWVVRACQEYPGIGVLKYQRNVVAMSEGV